jgi:hypothetical protein
MVSSGAASKESGPVPGKMPPVNDMIMPCSDDVPWERIVEVIRIRQLFQYPQETLTYRNTLTSATLAVRASGLWIAAFLFVAQGVAQDAASPPVTVVTATKSWSANGKALVRGRALRCPELSTCSRS